MVCLMYFSRFCSTFVNGMELFLEDDEEMPAAPTRSAKGKGKAKAREEVDENLLAALEQRVTALRSERTVQSIMIDELDAQIASLRRR